MRPFCLVFDLDDTLYLERDYVQSGFQAVDAWMLSTMGLAGFAQDAWRLFERGQRSQVFDNVLAGWGRKPCADLVARMVHVYRHHVPRITLLKDAQECLATLANCPNCHWVAAVALVSDGPLASQSQKVNALGLRSRFDQIVLTDQWGRKFRKPHARGFRRVEASAPQCRFVYVGDNPAKDFAAPRSLGWNTVRVRRREGLHYHAEPQPNGRPDLVVNTLLDLPEQLQDRFIRNRTD